MTQVIIPPGLEKKLYKFFNFREYKFIDGCLEIYAYLKTDGPRQMYILRSLEPEMKLENEMSWPLKNLPVVWKLREVFNSKIGSGYGKWETFTVPGDYELYGKNEYKPFLSTQFVDEGLWKMTDVDPQQWNVDCLIEKKRSKDFIEEFDKTYRMNMNFV